MLRRGLCTVLLVALVGCGAMDANVVEMKLDFNGDNGLDLSPTAVSANDGHFFYNGFPTDLRLKENGSIELTDFPRMVQNLVISYKNQLENSIIPSMGGYHTIMPVYLPFSGPLAINQLPANDEYYMAADASIQVVDVDPDSPEYGRRFPLSIAMTKVADSYRPADLLQLLPTLGIALRANTTYAAIVNDRVPLQAGYSLRQNAQLAAALGVEAEVQSIPDKALAVYQPLRDFLAQQGIDPASIIAATVWTTGDPKAQLVKGVEVAAALPQPAPTELRLLEDYPDYCVIEGKVETPLFQNGSAPYYLFGGYLDLDEQGYPAVRGTRQGTFVVTVPKNTTMPASGYPQLFFHHGAGGKAAQVYKRGGVGPKELDDGGNGPSRVAAYRGWASSGFGGHLAQDHLSLLEGYGEFAFNILQGIVLRNNYFQMVWERVFFRSFVAQLELDSSYCPDADPGDSDVFTFDNDMIVLMGQSLGSWTGSLHLASDSKPFKGAIFGGVAGTWTQYLRDSSLKRVALTVGAARLLPGESIDAHHPFMMLVEWVLGSVDPAAMNHSVLKDPSKTAPHVYIASGIGDVLTSEPAQLPFLLSMGVDLAGDEVGDTPKTRILDTLGPVGGAQQYPYPVTANLEVPGQGRRTATVSRYVNTSGRDDGHHVMFDLVAPKHQYACLLEQLAEGRTPIVGEGYEINGPCN